MCVKRGEEEFLFPAQQTTPTKVKTGGGIHEERRGVGGDADELVM